MALSPSGNIGRLYVASIVASEACPAFASMKRAVFTKVMILRIMAQYFLA